MMMVIMMVMMINEGICVPGFLTLTATYTYTPHSNAVRNQANNTRGSNTPPAWVTTAGPASSVIT